MAIVTTQGTLEGITNYESNDESLMFLSSNNEQLDNTIALFSFTIGRFGKTNPLAGVILRFHGLNIPADSQIVSAAITITGAVARSGQTPLIVAIGMAQRDERWNPDTTLGWHGWDIMDWPFIIRNASSGTVASNQPGSAANGSIPIKVHTTNINDPELLGQTFRLGSTETLGDIDVKLRRVGTDAGDVRIDVYNTILDPDQGLIPNTLLATSDNFAYNSLPQTLPPAFSTFVFSGGDQITLTSGVDYAFVVDSDYARDGNDFLFMHYHQLFGPTATYPNGNGICNGIGSGLDLVNYGTMLTLKKFTVDNRIGGFVPWSLPAAVGVGEAIVTPELKVILQEWISDPTYTNDGKMVFDISLTSAAIQEFHTFRASGNPSWDSTQTVLDVEYRTRNIYVG